MFAFLRTQLRATADILKGLRGNARACIVTEPGWAIPYHLYITYASLYMVALGCSERQVGTVTAVGLASAMVFSLIAGYITDKLGRRKTTLIFDLVGWSLPALIWAVAQGYVFFVVAAVINSVVRVVYISWNCLFIEDTEPAQRVHAYSWIFVASILAGFITPFAGLLVRKFTLVPTMRGLYLFATVCMTSMFLIRNKVTRETQMGLKKMMVTKDMRLLASVRDYLQAVRECVRDPVVLVAMSMAIVSNILLTLRTTFLPILLAGDLGFRAADIAIFPALYSGMMLLVYVFIMPSINGGNMRAALMYGLLFSIVGYALLIVSPQKSYALVITSTIVVAIGTGISGPVIESVLANSIRSDDRAKVMSVFHACMFAVSSPFGYLAGVLSSVSDRLPFAMAVVLLGAAVGLLRRLSTLQRAR